MLAFPFTTADLTPPQEQYTPWQIIVSTLTGVYAVRNLDKILGLAGELRRIGPSRPLISQSPSSRTAHKLGKCQPPEADMRVC